MKTVKLNGMSSSAYEFLGNVGIYIIIGGVILVVGFISKCNGTMRKQKALEKNYYKNKTKNMENGFDNGFSNNYNDNSIDNSPPSEPYNEIKDEWKL